MLIDLHHNKIVDSLITDDFERSVGEVLVPKLLSKHGESLFGIQMYEDYLNDDLLLDGEWYYPLTLMTDKDVLTEWISWRVDKKRFDGAIPYAYRGAELLEFNIVDNPPSSFEDKISGRARFAERGLIKVVPSATSPDPAFLSGKCSQTFIDELARQIGPAIESFTSVSGLADSSISLVLSFAPGTYLEHTSENVTYRRLLLSDGSSVPRDLWIKWTRLDGKGAFTVADNPSVREILFELGEDVPRKICEKEYRFLLGKGKDGYHRAMGRKNITEWREIIKRAVRRGELMKIEDMNEISEETRALDAMLAEVLGVDPAAKSESIPEAIEFTEVEEDAEDEFSLAMKFVRETALADSVEGVAVTETEAQEPADELEEFYSDSDDELSQENNTAEDEDELLLLTEMARAALADNQSELATAEDTEISFEEDTEYIDGEEDISEEEAPTVIVATDPTAEEYEEEIEDETISLEECDEDESEILAEQDMLEPEEEEILPEEETVPEIEKTPAPSTAYVPSDMERAADLEERIRREVETRLRLEYEIEARKKAEAEAVRLRQVEAELRMEIEKMREAQRIADEQRERELALRRAEEEKLRATIEQQMRSEAKEKERLAEAARIAVEEQRRLEDERARVEAMRLEEKKAAERRAEEERIEAERLAEAERIRREAEERAAAKETPEPAPETVVITPESERKYTYVSKNVRLRFRRSVDPNVTARIYEIIKATIEYYGKEKVYLRIKASVPDTETVCLDFVEIPLEEIELLSNIIKVLGNSGLGIAKAIVE